MSKKVKSAKPCIITIYGYPASGRTTLAKKLSAELGYAMLSHKEFTEDIAGKNNLSGSEVKDILMYMARGMVDAGAGVILDIDVNIRPERKAIVEFARQHKIKPLLIWLQIDTDTARHRAVSGKDAKYQEQEFNDLVGHMQKPTIQEGQDCIVVSGKHNFSSQKTSIIKKLFQMGIIRLDDMNKSITKPELVSLVPKPSMSGENTVTQRNISIS